MVHSVRRVRHVVREHGLGGLGRFLRKAAWERLSPTPTQMPFGPGHLQVEVSGKCNLRCPFCPRTFIDTGWQNLSFAEYRRIIESAPGLWSVNLQGFGEPLLNPELVDIVRWTHQRGIDVGFASNATLLSEARAEELIAAGLDWLNLSMDGATQSTYERFRVGAKFQQFLANVAGMVRVNRARGEAVRLAIAYVCMRSNIDEIPELYRLVHGLGIHTVFLAPILDLTIEAPEERLRPEDRRQLSAVRDQGRRQGLDVRLGVFGDRVEPGELPCDWPWQKTYVTATGKVTPCCIEPSESIGDALRDGVSQVWNSEVYRELRGGLVTAQPHPICRRNCFVGKDE